MTRQADLITAIATNAEIERQRERRLQRGIELTKMREEIDRFLKMADTAASAAANYREHASRMTTDADGLAKELSLLPQLPPMIDLDQFRDPPGATAQEGD